MKVPNTFPVFFYLYSTGAEAPVYLALLPKNCTKPKGDFVWHTKEIRDWVNDPKPLP